MYRTLIGKIGHTVIDRQDGITDLVLVEHIARLIDKTVYLCLGQAVNLAQFPDYRLIPEGRGGSHQCRMLTSIATKDIIVDMIAVAPREIHIEVRRILPLGIQKALEVKIEFYGTHISNPQTVGHYAVGTTAPPHIVKVAATGITAYIVCNKEVGRKVELVDNIKFPEHPLPCPFITTTVASLKTIHGKPVQKALIIPPVACKGASVLA